MVNDSEKWNIKMELIKIGTVLGNVKILVLQLKCPRFEGEIRGSCEKKGKKSIRCESNVTL